MSICWYCHWGWSKPVAAIYKRALAGFDGDDGKLQYGPSHVVWNDENFDTDCIEDCLKHIEKREYCDDHTDADLVIVKRSLEELLALPENIRDCAPDAYWDDDHHPEKYPPTVEMERIK
jgi:hypothetical protein